MDPNSSYLLEIRLFGTQDKKLRDYKCVQFTKVVDSDLCNFKDLVEEITDMFPHGYEEAVHVFYYDDVQNKFPLVTTDQQLLEMFAKHIDRKVVCMTVTYSNPTDGDEDITPIDIQEPLNNKTIQGPITRARARQLNLQVSSILNVPINNCENDLLSIVYNMIRNQVEDQATHEGRHGVVEDQQGTAKLHGGPIQFDFESTSKFRSCLQ
ncbi:hypothetical protein HU200_003476 [Digitaria exilis]|uniref:PB1 domain-containing protein n=1 Tax=Digitaria exilis TaxID=1010633 RepID=A0A835KYK3_9POAL|nr:hypothetical protein HU200_003476 [Digitaria exilis]